MLANLGEELELQITLLTSIILYLLLNLIQMVYVTYRLRMVIVSVLLTDLMSFVCREQIIGRL